MTEEEIEEAIAANGRSFDALEAVARACPVCGELPDRSAVLSTAASPSALPAAAYSFIPATLVRQNRCDAVVRCRTCETLWAYRRDYEFLVGGSEDEEFLDRLTPHLAIAAVRRAGTEPERQAAQRQLTRALSAELTAEGRSLRVRLRQTREVPDILLASERAARAGCPVCSRLEAGEAGELARYVLPASGRACCEWCGTGWRIGSGASDLEVFEADLDAALRQKEAEDFHVWLDSVDLDRRVRLGTPPLHFFLHHGLLDAAEAVVVDGPDVADEFGWTALHRASLSNCQWLLDRGAETDVRNAVGETPLYIAAEAGRTEVVAVLLAAGADRTLPCTGPSPLSKALHITGVAAPGTTPLGIARALGHAGVVDLLD